MLNSFFKRRAIILGLLGLSSFSLYCGVGRTQENMALWNQAENALRSGRNAEAILLYDRLVRSEPNNFEAYGSRALAKHKRGDFSGSIEDLNQAIKLYPVKQYLTIIREDGTRSVWDHRLASLLMNRGYNNQKLGNMKAAENDYTSAIKLFPIYEKAYLNRAHLHKINKNATASIRDFSKAIELNPRSSGSYFQRASVYAEINDAKNACSDLISASGLGNKDAMSNYDRLKRMGYCL